MKPLDLEPITNDPTPGAASVRSQWRLALLLAAAATLLLPLVWSGVLLLVLAGFWWWGSPTAPEKWWVSCGMVIAGLLLLGDALTRRPVDPATGDPGGEITAAYGRLWQGLADQASTAATRIKALRSAPPEKQETSIIAGEDGSRERDVREQELEYFRILREEIRRSGSDDLTLLLLNSFGEAVAWAGEGLLHQPQSWSLPEVGFSVRHSFTAVSLLAVHPLTEGRRPWRVVAGRSLATGAVPLALAHFQWGNDYRWWLASHEHGFFDDALRIDHPDAPSLWIAPPETTGELERFRWPSRLGLTILALTLIAVPFMRLTDRVWFSRVTSSGPRFLPPSGTFPVVTSVGAAVLGLALGLPVEVGASLALGAGLTTFGLLRRHTTGGLGRGEVWGLAIPFLLGGAFWHFQRSFGAADLASGLVDKPALIALRLALSLLSLGLILAVSRRGASPAGERFAWVALVALLAAAALHDNPWLTFPFLALAGASLVRWQSGLSLRARPGVFGALLVLSSLLAAVVWETTYRACFRQELRFEYLPQVTPTTREERNDLLVAVQNHLESLDLWSLPVPMDESSMDFKDLAYVLWRASPLALHDGLSSLVVEPISGEASSFAFGLALDNQLQVIPDPTSWAVPAAPAWRDTMLFGEAALLYKGEVWATAHYAFLPRPGFRFEVNEIDELESALLRGEIHRRAVDGLPRPSLYALYRPTGGAVSSPWEEAPPLPRGVIDSIDTEGKMATPSGLAWYYKQESDDGIEVLYLPVLGLREGLERAGIHALATWTILAALAILAMVLALPGITFRDFLQRSLRSYSKRLIWVYTLLILIPLIALNLVLLRSFQERLRDEQRDRAQEAIGSARIFLLDYLQGLPRGFDIDTQVNRTLLEWISNVIRHQVNLYWGSEVYTSSQQELFTAGLLPRRIPGEIYSRLVLLDYEIGERTRHTGELHFSELYAPLNVPGISQSQKGLFLSVPLLVQEEEVARELAALRRRALLVSTALFLLLVAVGSRLARRFTTPIMELIEGTKRIAGGAKSLDLSATPGDSELSSLATAIDDMAYRIAEGRRKLLLEKQLVERIVENIASAVVSLDHQRRVLLHNQVAADLLGAVSGESLQELLTADERLHPMADLLAEMGGEIHQATLKLQDTAGESRDWNVTWVPIPGPEDPAALLIVDDATDVLQAQRLAAWAEMARIIAHEIKNPLTPIRLSTEHLQRVFHHDRERFDMVFDQCADNILKQVEELRDIASDFSIYSRIPRAEMESGDLISAMEDVVSAYRYSVRSGGVEITLESEEKSLVSRFDHKLLSRAIRNLIENALRASAGREGAVRLVIEKGVTEVRLRVLDSGPGVDQKNLQRIFDPYFSTHESGTGLGLAITRRIVEEHSGRIEARNRPSGGLEVVITLPLTAET